MVDAVIRSNVQYLFGGRRYGRMSPCSAQHPFSYNSAPTILYLPECEQVNPTCCQRTHKQADQLFVGIGARLSSLTMEFSPDEFQQGVWRVGNGISNPPQVFLQFLTKFFGRPNFLHGLSLNGVSILIGRVGSPSYWSCCAHMLVDGILVPFCLPCLPCLEVLCVISKGGAVGGLLCCRQ